MSDTTKESAMKHLIQMTLLCATLAGNVMYAYAAKPSVQSNASHWKRTLPANRQIVGRTEFGVIGTFVPDSKQMGRWERFKAWFSWGKVEKVCMVVRGGQCIDIMSLHLAEDVKPATLWWVQSYRNEADLNFDVAMERKQSTLWQLLKGTEVFTKEEQRIKKEMLGEEVSLFTELWKSHFSSEYKEQIERSRKSRAERFKMLGSESSIVDDDSESGGKMQLISLADSGSIKNLKEKEPELSESLSSLNKMFFSLKNNLSNRSVLLCTRKRQCNRWTDCFSNMYLLSSSELEQEAKRKMKENDWDHEDKDTWVKHIKERKNRAQFTTYLISRVRDGSPRPSNWAEFFAVFFKSGEQYFKEKIWASKEFHNKDDGARVFFETLQSMDPYPSFWGRNPKTNALVLPGRRKKGECWEIAPDWFQMLLNESWNKYAFTGKVGLELEDDAFSYKEEDGDIHECYKIKITKVVGDPLTLRPIEEEDEKYAVFEQVDSASDTEVKDSYIYISKEFNQPVYVKIYMNSTVNVSSKRLPVGISKDFYIEKGSELKATFSWTATTLEDSSFNHWWEVLK